MDMIPSDTAAGRLKALRSAAAAWVVERLYQRHPELDARFGETGRQRCLEDIAYHTDFLASALDYQDPQPFVDYAGWLAGVLEARAVDTAQLGSSFALLGEFLAERLPAHAGAAQAILAAGRAALDAPLTGNPAFYRHLPEAAPELPEFSRALLRGDRGLLQRLFDEQRRQGRPWVDTAVALIQPALYEVGQLWQINRITVAQEHLATALCQTLLARTLLEADYAPPLPRKATFACVAGNHHTLGLRMVADGFELNGWTVDYLGGDTPSDALLENLDRRRPDVLGLSVSLPWQLAAARDLIDRCRAELGARRPAVLLGGLALNGSERLWRLLGADDWQPDARSAYRQALA